MEYENYVEKIKVILENENIKYEEEELKRVVEYAYKNHENKTILSDTTMDFVLEVASEVATLRLDDKSIYAALLYPVVDYDNFNEKELIDIAQKETTDLIITLKKLEEDYKTSDKINVATNPEVLRNMFMAIAKDI